MTLTKALAKKIIYTMPLSVELSGNFKFLFELSSPLDKIIQDWALRQTDLFSENDWKEIQLIKLKKILIHAGENVFYWRELFEKINFNPETFKDFSQLQKISPITRAEIKKISVEELTA